jgi:hypothetical protein
LRSELRAHGYTTDEEVLSFLKEIIETPSLLEVITICVEAECTPEDFAEELERKIMDRESKKGTNAEESTNGEPVSIADLDPAWNSDWGYGHGITQ